MQEYGVMDSWMRQFSLAVEQILWPLKFMDNGNVLLEMQSGNLVSCDAENQQIDEGSWNKVVFRVASAYLLARQA